LARSVDLVPSPIVERGIIGAYGYCPSIRIVVAIPFVLLALGTAVGASAWLASRNVKYRDVRYVVPFLLQLWMFASSVFYSVTALPLHQPWNTIYWINPMAGAVEEIGRASCRERG